MSSDYTNIIAELSLQAKKDLANSIYSAEPLSSIHTIQSKDVSIQLGY
jgi:hypothetical protein